MSTSSNDPWAFPRHAQRSRHSLLRCRHRKCHYQHATPAAYECWLCHGLVWRSLSVCVTSGHNNHKIHSLNCWRCCCLFDGLLFFPLDFHLGNLPCSSPLFGAFPMSRVPLPLPLLPPCRCPLIQVYIFPRWRDDSFCVVCSAAHSRKSDPIDRQCVNVVTRTPAGCLRRGCTRSRQQNSVRNFRWIGRAVFQNAHRPQS